jgi:glycosyltransferase involved in cell wall biosynthesis
MDFFRQGYGRFKKVNKFHPRILAILPGFIPSTIICVVKPFLELHRTGHINARITLERLVSQKDLKWAELVVFCRNTEPKYSPIMNHLLARSIPFIYELDDNFFELPLSSEFGKYHRDPERLAMLTNYMKFAGLVRVYSKPLLEKAKALNPSAKQVPGPIDLNLIQWPAKPAEKKIRLVYGTSRIQDELSAIFTPALIRILKEYTGRVEAHFWGAVPSELRGQPGVIYHPTIPNYDRFIRQFSRSGFDIGLAPLPGDLFCRSKTNNKFREYGACRIAGIYSDVDVYSDCVTHGENGLLVANDTNSWYQGLVKLIEDDVLRESIKQKAREFVQERYSQDKFETLWLNHIHETLAAKNQAVSLNRVLNETVQNPTPSRPKKRERIRYHLEKGLAANIKISRWWLFNLWMIFKLRMRLHGPFRLDFFKRDPS